MKHNLTSPMNTCHKRAHTFSACMHFIITSPLWHLKLIPQIYVEINISFSKDVLTTSCNCKRPSINQLINQSHHLHQSLLLTNVSYYSLCMNICGNKQRTVIGIDLGHFVFYLGYHPWCHVRSTNSRLQFTQRLQWNLCIKDYIWLWLERCEECFIKVGMRYLIHVVFYTCSDNQWNQWNLY